MRASFLFIFFLVAIINKCTSQGFVTLDYTTINSGITDNPSESLISSGPGLSNTTDHLCAVVSTISRLPLVSTLSEFSSKALSSIQEAIRFMWRTIFFLPGVGTIVSNILDFLGEGSSSLVSLLRSTVDWATSVVGKALSSLSGADEDSNTDALRRVLLGISENGTISLPQVLQSINSAIDSDSNLTKPLGDLRAALTGGGSPASDIIRRAIYAVPGADSGSIRISDLRRSIDVVVASEGNETATVLEPLLAALSDDDFFRRILSMPVEIVSRVRRFVEARMSNTQSFLMMLGPVGFAAGIGITVVWNVVKLILSPIWSVVSFTGSVIGRLVAAVLSPFRSVIDFTIGIASGFLNLFFAPISIIFNGLFSSLSFVGSILSNVIWAILSPIRLIYNLIINIVSGAFRLVFAPISIIWNIVTGLFRFLL